MVCGQSIITNTDLVGRVKDALGERVAGVFGGGKTGSPLTSVLEGVSAAREIDADGIVAVLFLLCASFHWCRTRF